MDGVQGPAVQRFRAAVDLVIADKRMARARAGASAAAAAVARPIARAATNELEIALSPEQKLARRAVAVAALGAGAAVTVRTVCLVLGYVALAALSSATYGDGGYFEKSFPPPSAMELLQRIFFLNYLIAADHHHCKGYIIR